MSPRPERLRRPGNAGSAAAAWAGALLCLAPLLAAAGPASTSTSTSACWLTGWPQAARCGVLQRPLDPARPQGPRIDVHFAVVPALARNKAPDAVFFFAGGPGQSAIHLGGQLAAAHSRLQQRRDLVFVDQRGTGRSAPLACPDDDQRAVLQSLAARGDQARRLEQLQACRQSLQALPHGDLRFYTTEIAMADVDAVRQALGIAQINAIGASYGTRAVLSYQRQFPQAVRRAVLDGVAPPDMRLPDAGAIDNQAAWDALLQACAADAACHRRHPALAQRLPALLAALPHTVQLPHPVTGRLETVSLTRDALLSMVRTPLYSPPLAAGLPAALDEAAAGRWAPLAALGAALGGPGGGFATGQHFSVVCSEDLGPGAPVAPSALSAPAAPSALSAPAAPSALSAPAAPSALSAPAAPSALPAPAAPSALPAPAAPSALPAPAAPPTLPASAVFAGGGSALYQAACAGWPRGAVSPAFYSLPPAVAPTWLLSGSLDPVTPPRHGQRVAQALGPLARHITVPHVGHGTLALPCLRDAVARFISTDDAAAALATRADCAAALPRPPAFLPPGGTP